MDRGHVVRVEAQQRELLLEQLFGPLDLFGGHVVRILGAAIDRRDHDPVDQAVDHRQPARVPLVPQQPPRLLLDLDEVRAVGDGGLGPVHAHPVPLAVDHDTRNILHGFEAVGPVAQPGRVDRREKAGVAPLRNLVRAGHRDVGLETGPQLGERLLLVAEECVVRRFAVLVDIVLDKPFFLVSRPGEDQRMVFDGGLARPRDERDRDKAEAGSGQDLVEVPPAYLAGCELVEKFVSFHRFCPPSR